MPIQNLPSFFDMIYTNQDGHLSQDGYLYNDQMFQVNNLIVSGFNSTVSTYIQKNTENPYGLTTVPQPGTLVILGINPPSYTTAQINAISAALNPDGSPVVPIGTIWYNSDADKLQFKGASAVQTVTST